MGVELRPLNFTYLLNHKLTFNSQPPQYILLNKSSPLVSTVKQEPTEVEIKKVEAAFRPPPLPEPEVLPELLHRWSLSKGEELFFLQLPDSLPGQPPSIETRPVKAEVQTADGQVMVQKTESQVDTQSLVFLIFLLLSKIFYLKKNYNSA